MKFLITMTNELGEVKRISREAETSIDAVLSAMDEFGIGMKYQVEDMPIEQEQV